MKLIPMTRLPHSMALAALLLPAFSSAQSPFTWTPSAGPSVEVEGATLLHPFAGGLTAPQWSGIDMDLDGDEDLFAFVEVGFDFGAEVVEGGRGGDRCGGRGRGGHGGRPDRRRGDRGVDDLGRRRDRRIVTPGRRGFG